MTDHTEIARFAAFAEASRDSLPADVGRDVTNRVLDAVGNMLAGRAESVEHADVGQGVLRAVSEWGGQPQASVVGGNERLPAPSVALVNGTFAHALDFDDTHLPSILHPSASVVPAALAVAEAVGAESHHLLSAVAAGIEVCNRLGMASYLPEIRNSLFFEKGFHATSICGTVGSAVAAGMLYGLDAEGLASAMGVACSMGAGILEANRTGGTVKKVHCGWAAHAGVAAAMMAREGVTGPPTVLEGRFGFFSTYLDGRYNRTAMLSELGTRWELMRTVYKPYPSNHFTHPGIDCALALRAAGLDPADIADIELGVAAPTLRTIGEPWQAKVAPESAYHAKFSAPFTIATALLGGGGLGVYLDDFAQGIEKDPQRLALSRKVICVDDARASELFPNSLAAVLTATTRGGSVLSHRVDSSRGGPQHPLTLDEHRLKFRLNAGRALPAGTVLRLEEAAVAFADGVPVDRLLSLTRP